MKRTRTFLRLCLALSFLLVVAACSSPPRPDPDPDPDPPMDVSGIWRVREGNDVFPSPFAGRYLLLPEAQAGSGELLSMHAATGALACMNLSYTTVGDGAMVYSLEGAPLMIAAAELLLVEQPDDDTLLLSAAGGGQQTFERVASVPADYRCGTAEVETVAAHLGLQPYWSSDLEADGTDLWVQNDPDELLYAVDPTSGEVAAVGIDISGFTQYRMPVAMEDGHFWVHCSCGGSESVQLRSQVGALLATVDTEAAEFPVSISVRSGAVDGDSVLWLSGYADDGRGPVLYGVDTSLVPPEPVALWSLASEVRGMTFLGGEMWTLNEVGATHTLTSIDTSTGLVTRTVKLGSDAGANPRRYFGLAAHDGRLYSLLGDWGRETDLLVIDP